MSLPIRVVALPDGRQINPYQQLLADALCPLGVEIDHPPGYRRVLPLSRVIWARYQTDLLHLHWPSMYLRSVAPIKRTAYCLRTLADVALVRTMNVPVVWTLHNLVTHDTPTPRLEFWFSRQLAALVDHVIVHSEGARQEAIRRLAVKPEKVTVVPHGSYRSVYGSRLDRRVARARLRIADDVKLALFFGTVRPYKGVSQLLKAWPHVTERVGDIVLHVAGKCLDPSYEDEIRSLAAGQPNITLDLEYVSNDDVAPLLSAADVMVLPFKDSLTSGTIALANNYDIPVVTPKYEGTAALKRGVFATSTDPESMAAAIAECISLPPLDGLSSSEVDDWPEVARKHREIYGACLGIRCPVGAG